MGPEKEGPFHIIIKTIHVQNKERILKVSRGKGQVPDKDRSVRITPDSAMEPLKATRA